ncbi:MAG: TSUP family transporter [Chitinophagaceae bacterium]|nr:TSUP family transporter [Chitinophagaceae bacterium]
MIHTTNQTKINPDVNIKNRLYPVFLKLEKLQLLIVGGGKVALEKLNSVLNNSPSVSVTLVAPDILPEIEQLALQYKNVTLMRRPFEEEDLNRVQLVICAADNKTLHQQIKKMANEKNILVNVADTPELCDFYLSSIVQKGHLKIAISSNGLSPTMTKRLKEVFDRYLPEELDESIENLHKIRQHLKGDFAYKVKKLNAITQRLVENKRRDIDWKKVITNSFLFFAAMVLGYFVFSYVPLDKLVSGGEDILVNVDPNFFWWVVAGFAAQLVDGSLGMGYGVTCISILMTTGVSPAAISSSIHTSEIFTTAASGYSHYKFGNVNKKLFRILVIPGVVGAIAGAVVLVWFGNRYSDWLRAAVAVYTLYLGIKFVFNAFRKVNKKKKIRRYGLLAVFGGFFDSFGGGGWGPIVTATLVNSGRQHKYVVGSVSMAEFFITLASAVTFFTLVGLQYWQIIVALILGGVVAAPLAARLAGRIPQKTAYVALGTIVIIWSIRLLVKIF